MTQELLTTSSKVADTIDSVACATSVGTSANVFPVTSRQPLGIPLVRPAEPTRILHIISDLSVAGAETKLCKVLAATNRERFAPAVISMRNRGALREQIQALGIPVYTLGLRGSLPGPIAVARLIRLVRQLQPELIHGWMYHGNLAAQFARSFTTTKPSVLWSVHQSLYSFDYEKWLTTLVIKLGARISQRPDKIIYVSNTSAAQHEAVGYHQAKRAVHYYGFDTEKFAPSAEARQSVRVELGLAPDAILIGLAGRYHPVKDHANFLRAAALLAKRHPDVRFVMCGRGVADDNAALRILIQELDLAACTHLLGERGDIQRIFAALDIAVSASFSEGFPNVVGEAMSSGVPCVVTAVSDLPEVVGATGRAVQPRNAAALAAALEELIAMGSAGRKDLGAAARRRIIDHFSLTKAVAQYEETYESLLGEARARNSNRLSLTPSSRSGVF